MEEVKGVDSDVVERIVKEILETVLPLTAGTQNQIIFLVYDSLRADRKRRIRELEEDLKEKDQRREFLKVSLGKLDEVVKGISGDGDNKVIPKGVADSVYRFGDAGH